MADDCIECPECGEPYCSDCQKHYAECNCPGPHQDDVFEYDTFNGDLYAKPL